MRQTMAWKALKNTYAMGSNENIRYVDIYKRLKKYKNFLKPIICLKQKLIF